LVEVLVSLEDNKFEADSPKDRNPSADISNIDRGRDFPLVDPDPPGRRIDGRRLCEAMFRELACDFGV
jgi:hypothetical protein